MIIRAKMSLESDITFFESCYSGSSFYSMLFDMLDDVEVYPIELEAREHECSAIGFVTPEATALLDYDYETSGLHDFIASILDDMDNEAADCTYEFKGVKIWLSR